MSLEKKDLLALCLYVSITGLLSLAVPLAVQALVGATSVLNAGGLLVAFLLLACRANLLVVGAVAAGGLATALAFRPTAGLAFGLLLGTGWLHNHARMWMAAYIIHWRRIRWQAGAKWFLEHLLDGDPASNNMSWQWVASTFSHKPYFFNRENLERYTNGVYCRECPLYGHCDFEGSYEQIEQRLFPKKEFNRQPNSQSWQRGKGIRKKS